MPDPLFFSIVAFVFGIIIGSFLNVVIYRLHTGKSINTPSHCLSCGTPLRWYELFPVLSYLFLRARCRSCGAYVPVRYLLVELLTGFTFLLLWSTYVHNISLLLLNAVLFSALIVISVYDIRHTIIPNDVLAVVYGAVVLLMWHSFHVGAQDLSTLLYDIGAGVGAGGFFFGLWYISHGRWVGLGDAKLTLPLGTLVGTAGVFSMVVLSFWIGAAISLFMLSLQRILKKGKTTLPFISQPLTIKSEVPFAPFLIIGFLLVHLFNANIFDIIVAFFPL